MILFGMVYVYLPFMLFPMTLGLSMVPNETREAALRSRRLAAGRSSARSNCRSSMPGIMIGMLLTFVLAVGAIAEAKILGGQTDHPDHPRYRDRLHLCAELAARRGARRAAHAGRRHARAARAAAASTSTPSWGAVMTMDASAPAMHSSGPGRSPSWSSSICRRLCILLASLTAEPLFPVPDPEMGPRLVAQDLRLDRDPSALQDLDLDRRSASRSSPSSSPSSARSPSRATTGRAAPLYPEDRAAADLLPAIGAGPRTAAVVQRARPQHVVADRGLRPSRLDHPGRHARHLDPGLQLRSRHSRRRPSISAPRAGRCSAK